MTNTAPDGSENPTGLNAIFSCHKRATNGSSFYGIRKKEDRPRSCNGQLDQALIKMINTTYDEKNNTALPFITANVLL